MIDWRTRIAAYRSTGFPVCMGVGEDGRLFGIWNMGNDYRVRSGYHGGYPNTYLRRVRALFPEPCNVLHLFSGMVDLAAFPGDTVDLNAELGPTYLDDAQTLEHVPLERYDLVLADPPYTDEDASCYGFTMVNRNRVMQSLQRLRPGAVVVWLDMVKPMYSKAAFDLVGSIGVERSTNHRFRVVNIFERKGT
jgi:hypothetical protein